MAWLETNVRGDAGDIRRHLTAIQRKVSPAAEVSALTGVVREIRREVRREMQSELSLRPSHTKGRIREKRATIRHRAAKLIVRNRDIPLISVGARQVRRGVRAAGKLWERSWIGRRGYTGTRLNTTLQQQVFQRVGKRRYPITVPKLPWAAKANARVRAKMQTAGGRFRRLYVARVKAALARRNLGAAPGLDAEA